MASLITNLSYAQQVDLILAEGKAVIANNITCNNNTNNNNNASQFWDICKAFYKKYKIIVRTMEYVEQEAAVSFCISRLKAFLASETPPTQNEVRFAGTILGIFAILCRNQANKVTAREGGGVDIVSRIMAAYPESSHVQKNGCWALRNLIYGGWKIVDNMESVKRVTFAMENHRHKTGVQTRGWQALDGFAYEDGEVLIKEKGILENVISEMKKFPTNESLLDCACSVLCSAFCNLSDEVQKEIRETIVVQGGVEEVLDIMTRYRENIDIQESGCYILWGLANGHEKNKEILASKGGFKCLMESMELHKDVPKVQESACMALTSFTTVTEEHKAVISQKGADLVVAAMLNHKDHVGVQEVGCCALRNISVNRAASEVLAKQNGGLERVLAGMATHLDSDIVQENGCCTIRNLAYYEENRQIVAEKGSAKVVIAGMRRHKQNPELQKRACEALNNISLGNKTLSYITSEGGVDCLVEAIQLHIDEIGVLTWAISTLYVLTELKENRILVIESGGIDLAIEALAKHHEDMHVLRNHLGNLFSRFAHNIDWLDAGLERTAVALAKHDWDITKFGDLGRLVLRKYGEKYGIGCPLAESLKYACIKVIITNQPMFPDTTLLDILPEEVRDDLKFAIKLYNAVQKSEMPEIINITTP